MVATLEAVWDRGHVVFGAACYMHGLLTSPDWQTLEVLGVEGILGVKGGLEVLGF